MYLLVLNQVLQSVTPLILSSCPYNKLNRLRCVARFLILFLFLYSIVISIMKTLAVRVLFQSSLAKPFLWIWQDSIHYQSSTTYINSKVHDEIFYVHLNLVFAIERLKLAQEQQSFQSQKPNGVKCLFNTRENWSFF